MGLKETGFPSPAQGYEAKSIDFNDILIKNKSTTYVMEYKGSDLLYLGVYPNSKLIIDRSVKPQDDCLVIFTYEGQFHCRKWVANTNHPILVNSQGNAITLTEDVCIFGVVTNIIRSIQPI